MTGGNFPSRDPADSGWGEHGGVNRKKKQTAVPLKLFRQVTFNEGTEMGLMY